MTIHISKYKIRISLNIPHLSLLEYVVQFQAVQLRHPTSIAVSFVLAILVLVVFLRVLKIMQSVLQQVHLFLL